MQRWRLWDHLPKAGIQQGFQWRPKEMKQQSPGRKRENPGGWEVLPAAEGTSIWERPGSVESRLRSWWVHGDDISAQRDTGQLILYPGTGSEAEDPESCVHPLLIKLTTVQTCSPGQPGKQQNPVIPCQPRFPITF